MSFPDHKYTVMDDTLRLKPAEPAQATGIAALVNAAFRSEPSGQTWLTDDQYKRTDMVSIKNVQEILNSPSKTIVVGTLATTSELVPVCVLEDRRTHPKTTDAPDKAWLANLAINPSYHRHGYGVTTLKRAEAFAREMWGAKRLELCIANTRVELRAWYEKNGYRTTGEKMPFPYGNHRQGLMADGLELLVLGRDI